MTTIPVFHPNDPTVCSVVVRYYESDDYTVEAYTTVERLTAQKLQVIAENRGMTPHQAEGFALFMLERFTCIESSYPIEWAERFRDGIAWAKADLETRSVLLRMRQEGWELPGIP